MFRMFTSKSKIFMMLSLSGIILVYLILALVLTFRGNSSLESLVKFEIPITSNVTLKQLCTSQTVFVRYLPDENNKRSQDSNLGEVTIDIEEKQNLKPLQLTPPIVVAWVYHLLRSITEVFERHGIRYSIESGTAIGSLRHHGLIPWDDDLDIAVLEEDESKLLGPVSKDLRQNYNISWERHTSVDYKFFSIFNQNSVKLESMKDEPIRYPFADVFIYAYNQTEKKFRYRNWRRDFIKGGIRSFDLSSGTKMVPFGDFKTRISVDMTQYLDDYDDYGSTNWRHIGVTQSYNHVYDKHQPECKFQLTPRLYAPAYPFRLESIFQKEDGVRSKPLVTKNASAGDGTA